MADDADNAAFIALSRAKPAGAEALWVKHAPRMHAYARAVLSRSNEQHHADDVVQQVFLSVMKLGPRRAKAVRSVEAWLITATRTTALNVARGERRERSRRRKTRREPMGPPSTHERLRTLVERLPPHEAEVVALRHGFGLSYDDIAELLGSKKSTVASRHARAMERLRTMLAGDTHTETAGHAPELIKQEVRRA